MSWVWILYSEIIPSLPVLGSLAAGLLLLVLLRPLFNHFLRIDERRDLLREQVRLQKKILEEMQFLRFSASKIGSVVLPPKKEEENSVFGEDEPIQIELKKDPL